MKRAYSLITIKAIDDDKRIITGIATTPTPDRVGDIVEPKGAEFKLPIPFLWQHNSREPLGHVTKAKVTAEGIEFTAELVDVPEPGKLKDRLDEAWQSIKYKLVRGASIGFKDLDLRFEDGSHGIRFTKWLWLELSAVTIPANGDCSIQTVKSLDAAARLAAGLKDDPLPVAPDNTRKFKTVRLTPPASGNNSTPIQEGNMKIGEKIKRFEEKRAANSARIAAIHEENDESLSDAQLDEVKTLEAEIATIDRDLPSLRRVEADLVKGAKPVKPGVVLNENEGSAAASVVVKAQPKVEPGIRFARYVRCIGLAHKEKMDVLRVAKTLYGERDPEIVNFIQKAAGTAIGALNSTTDSSLIGNEGVIGDFVEFLRAKTIIGRFGTAGIPSLRSIPFRVPLISQATGGTAYWVGEGDGKPLTKPSFGRSELAPLKVAAITVATMELLRDSSPAAEKMLRDDLANAVAARLDVTFIDPSVDASAGVSPASIAFGAESITSVATTDADAIRNEVRSVMLKFVNALNPLTSGVWMMSSSTALALSMMVNTLGQPEFPGLTINGGTFQGLPVLVSDHITDYVVLANASDIWLGDEGGLQIDMSDQASLQMVAGDDQGSTLSSITPTATSVVSMFQTDSVAFRAERTMSWARRRTSAVACIEDVDWGGVALT